MLNYYNTKKLNKGFTLIEIIAVILVIVILSAIVLLRIGDVRTASYQTVAAQIERSFSKGVEDLAVNGHAILPALQAVTHGAPIETNAADPAYLGLSTRTYAVSLRSSPDLTGVNNVLQPLNTMLHATGYGAVSGSPTIQMLQYLNVYLVTVSDSSNNIVDVAIKFTK